LTPEQSHKIEALVEQSVERRKQGAKQIKELRRSIARLLSAPELDEAQVFSTLTASGELGTRQRRDIVTMRIQVRQVLSTEQFRKLLELHPKVMQQRWVPRRIRVKGTRPPAAAEPAPQHP
jgi:Spy/CpxP family protein refolding chaperone